MRYRRYDVMTIVIVVLLAIGLLSGLVRNPGMFLIPLAVLGVIFLLYKFPPSRWNRKPYGGSAYQAKPKQQQPKPKRNVTFRVIQGNKRDDEEPPKYH